MPENEKYKFLNPEWRFRFFFYRLKNGITIKKIIFLKFFSNQTLNLFHKL